MRRIRCFKSISFMLIFLFFSVYRGPTASAASGTWKYDTEGTWFCYSDGSYVKSDWLMVSGRWYLFDSVGYMQTGWQKISGKWYYFGTDGSMKIGWKKIGEKWYYFNRSGEMKTGWCLINKKWYYLKNGVMQTGWMKSGGNWFYFEGDGAMVSGTREIDNKIFQFNSQGVLQTEITDVKESDDENMNRYLNVVDTVFRQELKTNYSITVDNDDIVIRYWRPGFTQIMNLMKYYPERRGQSWINIVNAFRDLAKVCYNGFDEFGIRNKNSKLYFVNEVNQNEVYLAFINGILVYDCLATP